jgi:hypothetical protein
MLAGRDSGHDESAARSDWSLTAADNDNGLKLHPEFAPASLPYYPACHLNVVRPASGGADAEKHTNRVVRLINDDQIPIFRAKSKPGYAYRVYPL